MGGRRHHHCCVSLRHISYSGEVVREIRRRKYVSGALGRFLVLVLALAGLAACGQQVIRAPTGPQAAPSPDPATAVMHRACSTAPKSDIQARDVTFMQSAMLRQGAQLQRVADDLSGAVPGGNLSVDTDLARSNARELADLVAKSTLCSPFKEKLVVASKDLATADDTLVSATGGGNVATSLQASEDKLQALKTLTETPSGS